MHAGSHRLGCIYIPVIIMYNIQGNETCLHVYTQRQVYVMCIGYMYIGRYTRIHQTAGRRTRRRAAQLKFNPKLLHPSGVAGFAGKETGYHPLLRSLPSVYTVR